jgi:hypothetical protein
MLLDAEGRAVPIDGIGAKEKYSYSDSDEPIAVIYLDEHDKIIPVEVEVKDVRAGGAAPGQIGTYPVYASYAEP